MPFRLNLRAYQSALVDRVRASYQSGRGAPILQLPTGAGKTVIAAYIMGAAGERGTTTVFLVHRVELIRQTSATLTEAGIPHGIIHPQFPQTHQRLQVASVQTLVRRLRRFPSFDFIVIDEAHHSPAGTWRKIIEHYGDAHLLGLTATPARLDGKGLGIEHGGFYDDLICGPSMRELIDGGYLAKPKIYASPRHLDFSALRIRAGDFAVDDADRMMSNREIVGDAVAHYHRHLMGKRALAFCVSIHHAEMVTAQFNASGIHARRIDGTMTPHERAALVQAFVANRVNVLTSCELISEGFDVPACDGALLLRPTQSETLYLQQIGRALRASPGKTHAIILDHVGNAGRHGLPDEDREWTLAGRTRRNAAVPTTKQCPQCFAVLPIAVEECPDCEHSFADAAEAERRAAAAARARELEYRDGELVEVTEEMRERISRARADEVRRAHSREELLVIARQRGYHHGWVDHVMRARQRAGGQR